MLATQLNIPVFPTLASDMMLSDPLGVLVAFFTMLGLVFIVKAVGHLGIDVWVDLRNEFIVFWLVKVRKRKFFRPVPHMASRHTVWGKVPVSQAARTANAGEVLFPGQPSFVEKLTLAYSEDENDEALFYLCCKEELEDILSEAEALTANMPPREDLPLYFLPRVTEDELLNKNMQYANSPGKKEENMEGSQIVEKKLGSGDLSRADRVAEVAGEVDENVGVSIFEDLLLKCDSEARLALMPELLAVGDEKELKLLESMSGVADKRVRRLAVKLCAKLRKQLQLELEQKPVAIKRKPDSSG
jgi:hypothetical protein